MEIRSVCVCMSRTGGFRDAPPAPTDAPHVKSLPFLSVVQSLRGSYAVSLDGGAIGRTGPMGVFVAPKTVRQTIWHLMDPETGRMDAQWVFLDVEINRLYRLDDLFSFPLILPPAYNAEIDRIIRETAGRADLLESLPSLHRLVNILLENATPLPRVSSDRVRLQNYLDRRYAEDLTPDDLAEFLSCSRSKLHRIFDSLFGQPPLRYLNELRIRHAQLLLITTDLPVGRVAETVGFPDACYFSRLFRRMTGLSPTEFRRRG